ncbi:MAG: alpha/beta hydrolase family protein [Xanthobacteraceae bacterium]|uniref:alpha/beta hydrolase family protein n=1 Tax=Pseudolabrys sp. TaxID=1960880 RepID=UPI003D120C39
MAGFADGAIEQITENRLPHYEPYGWHHWPEHPWLAYQFRRGLGESQEGGGTVSEIFLAASRMEPGSLESWHVEWKRIADRNWQRGLDEEKLGHIRTAMNCFLRAADYYRQAEFHLEPNDPRRLPTFEAMEACSKKFIGYLNPPGEAVDIPYEDGKPICAYFVRAPFPGKKLPVLICMGGLDSIKDEMWFMQAHGCLQRGISVLMIDGPGQGGTLRRHKIHSRHDSEAAISKCIDWLEKRPDVDASRIALCGSSLGGYYAARAGCYEHRLAACISHGAIWDVHEMWKDKGEDFGLAMHIKWVLGAKTMKEAMEKAKAFTLDGHLQKMRCPYLIVHGGYDVLTVSAATKARDYALKHGVDVTFRLVQPDETGAEHCQHDNPTIGQEILADWLADKFGIDQRALLKTSFNPLV